MQSTSSNRQLCAVIAFRTNLRFLAGIFCGAAGLIVCYSWLAREPVRTASDLAYLTGEIERYSFTQPMGTLSRYRDADRYLLWLKGLPTPFSIPASFQSYFNRAAFENNIGPGHNIQLAVAKVNKDKLFAGADSVPVYSIRSSSEEYLDERSCIQAHNSAFPLFFAFAFFMVGTMAVYRKRKLRTK